MKESYQNLALLQNLYRLKAMGFTYIDPFTLNKESLHVRPQNIQELHKEIASCHLCDLSKSRTQAMQGYGNTNADIMIIDFNVSQIQDSTNNYFSGRSGEILQKMVENVLQIPIEQTYYTHMIKCKTLHNNTSSKSEYDSCKNYLYQQIDFIQPKVIILLGEQSYNSFMGEENPFENVRGHIINFKNHKLVPIYHPQYLLRNPELKKIALNDLKVIKSCL
jgi:DNA polymerase